MENLGQPSSYLVLGKGVAMYSSDGKDLGKVEHVLAVPDLDVFDGFVIVSVFDLHSPIWLIIAIAIAGVVVGVTMLHSVKRRLAA